MENKLKIPSLREGATFLQNYYGGKFGKPDNSNLTEVAQENDISQESINLYVKEKFGSENIHKVLAAV